MGDCQELNRPICDNSIVKNGWGCSNGTERYSRKVA